MVPPDKDEEKRLTELEKTAEKLKGQMQIVIALLAASGIINLYSAVRMK